MTIIIEVYSFKSTIAVRICLIALIFSTIESFATKSLYFLNHCVKLVSWRVYGNIYWWFSVLDTHTHARTHTQGLFYL